jgi:hypothetical protein
MLRVFYRLLRLDSVDTLFKIPSQIFKKYIAIYIHYFLVNVRHLFVYIMLNTE